MNYERPRQSAGCATRATREGKGGRRKKKRGEGRKGRTWGGEGNMVFNTLSRFFPPPPPIFFTSGRVRTLTRLI